MADPVVFGTPVQTLPVGHKFAVTGWERPDNRDEYYILKHESTNGDLFFQIRTVGVGWGTATAVGTGGVGTTPAEDFAFNSRSDRMVLWRNATGHAATKYISADGLTTVSTTHTSTGATNGSRVSVCAIGARNFRIAFAWDHDTDGNYDLYYRDFDPILGTWGTLTNYGRPGAPGVVGVNAVRMKRSPLDGRIHYVCTARIVSAGGDNLYRTDDGTWLDLFGLPSPGYPASQVEFFDFQLSYLDKEVMFVVAGDYSVGAPPTSALRLYTRNDQQIWSEETIHISGSQGANTPQMEIDTNDDLYVIWKEFNTTDNKVAVYFRRRLANTGLFETPVLVGNSLFNTATSTAQERPVMPAIIRAPIGGGIQEFCVMWGDDDPVSQNYVYVTCADISNGNGDEEIEDSELLKLNTIYVLDEPAGGPWAKWRASGVVATAQLSVTAWLALDATKDDSNLLWGTGEDTGTSQLAWVNELLKGYHDNGEAIALSWPTAVLDMDDPGIVKDFMAVDMRISTMGSSAGITYTWSLDGGLRTGSFTVTKVGQHNISLPQVVGRVLSITVSETGIVEPPILEYFHLWWRPRADKRTKRSEE